MGDVTGHESRMAALSLESQAKRERSQNVSDSIWKFAEVGDIKGLNKFVEIGVQKGYPESVTLMEKETVLGMMPLHVAAEHGQKEVVEWLISKRVDSNAGDRAGVVPLHLAAIGNHLDIARMLITAQADVNFEDKAGDSPMHWAATKGHEAMLELLLLKRAKVDQKNKAGWTPLLRAAYNGRDAAVKLLIKHGANVQARTKEGNTSLHLACVMNHLPVLQALLSLGAPMDLVNQDGKTCYDLCFTDGARELCDSFGYAHVVKEDIEKKRAEAEAEAASHAMAKETEAKLKMLEKTTKANYIVRRESRQTDDFPDEFLTAPTTSSKPSFNDPVDDGDGFESLKPSAFLREVAQATDSNPYTIQASSGSKVREMTPCLSIRGMG